MDWYVKRYKKSYPKIAVGWTQLQVQSFNTQKCIAKSDSTHKEAREKRAWSGFITPRKTHNERKAKVGEGGYDVDWEWKEIVIKGSVVAVSFKFDSWRGWSKVELLCVVYDELWQSDIIWKKDKIAEYLHEYNKLNWKWKRDQKWRWFR